MTPDTYICMPTLSLVALAVLRVRRQPVATIHYGILPRYLRAARVLFRVSEETVARVVGGALGCKLVRIKHEHGVAGYPAINLRAMEAVVPATLGLEPLFKDDPWIKKLASLVGEEPALAFASQHIAHAVIWPQYLQVTACSLSHPGVRLLVVGSPEWSQAFIRALENNLPGVNFGYYQWPDCYRGIARRWGVAGAYAKAFLVFLCCLGRIVLRAGSAPTPVRYFKIATEFIQPDRLNGGVHDADFFVDGQIITPADTLLVITREQERRLRRKCIRFSELELLASAKGYSLIRLGGAPVPFESLSRWLGAWLGSPWTGSASTWHGVLSEGARRYLEWAILFARHRMAVLVYLKFPNGDTGWRTDTAIVTGLARQHGVTVAGLQNRVVYSAHYEFAFDCYDRFFVWGPAWYAALAPAMRHAGAVEVVGCLYLDALKEADTGGASSGTCGTEGAKTLVTVFTGDTAGSHYTLDYNVSFLAACLELAADHPDLEFKVKCKDPEHADQFEADARLSALRSKAPNFAFIRQARHNYRDLLLNARAVLALGYTTPGAEALLFGKPTVYYSELEGGGKVFGGYPHWVARTPAELKACFALAISPTGVDSDDLQRSLDLLDPFHDGRARERMNAALFA